MPQAYRYVQRPVQPLPADGMGYGEDGFEAYVSIEGKRCTDGRLAVSGKRARVGLFPAFPLVRPTLLQTVHITALLPRTPEHCTRSIPCAMISC
jgi:hypothetical protein